MLDNKQIEQIQERILSTESIIRCPTCFKLPDSKFYTEHTMTLTGKSEEKVMLMCEQHGHYAIGKDYQQAIAHWNIYIRFYKNEFLGLKSVGLEVKVLE